MPDLCSASFGGGGGGWVAVQVMKANQSQEMDVQGPTVATDSPEGSGNPTALPGPQFPHL